MPELPEIHVISQCLNKKLSGMIITKIRVDDEAKHVNLDTIPDGNYKVISVNYYGKRILFNIESLDGVDIMVIASFLGMEGRWCFQRGKHTHIGMRFHDPTCKVDNFSLYFDDSRHFGNVTLCRYREDLDRYFSRIGIDIYQINVTDKMWLDRLRNNRIKHMNICDFLLKQQYFAGIGNYLRAEILYEAKVDPFKSLRDISDEDLLLILKYARIIIQDSIRCNGLTISSYWSPDGLQGTYPVKVYGRYTDPHGNRVEKKKDRDNRTVHYVPAVQCIKIN